MGLDCLNFKYRGLKNIIVIPINSKLTTQGNSHPFSEVKPATIAQAPVVVQRDGRLRSRNDRTAEILETSLSFYIGTNLVISNDRG